VWGSGWSRCSGSAHWEDGILYVEIDSGTRVAVTENVEIIGWTPQLDFGTEQA
jgi:hypothetical protein